MYTFLIVLAVFLIIFALMFLTWARSDYRERRMTSAISQSIGAAFCLALAGGSFYVSTLNGHYQTQVNSRTHNMMAQVIKTERSLMNRYGRFGDYTDVSSSNHYVASHGI